MPETAEGQEHWEPQAKAVLCKALSGSGLAALGCRRTEDDVLRHERITLAPGDSSCVWDLPGYNDNTDYPYMEAVLGHLILK